MKPNAQTVRLMLVDFYRSCVASALCRARQLKRDGRLDLADTWFSEAAYQKDNLVWRAVP